MAQVLKDSTKGTLQISDIWSITGTGAQAPPSFTTPDQEFIYSFVNLTGVEALKTFAYDYTGQVENRYLRTFYRISRNGTNWSDWLVLDSHITNFPLWTATDTMYLEIKFVRKGSSTFGIIKLLEYQLNGSVVRNLVDGESAFNLNANNNVVIVKPPHIFKVFRITDIEVLSNGVIDTDFTIKYRFSQDYGRTVTDWEYFTKENITTIRISPIRFFQIEYLVELKTSNATVYDINLIGDFQNVTLDYTKTNLYGVRENCNSLVAGLVNDPSTFPAQDSGGMGPDGQGGSGSGTDDCGTVAGGNSSLLSVQNADECVIPPLSQEQQNNLYQPYGQLQAATNLLNNISNTSTQMFGHNVVYFLTDPDKKGIDYTFHEYQLYNYVSDKEIKVSVENNQFPENNGAINQFDLSLFDSFEIHITKEVFKAAFGVDKRPSKEDFLWFCQINKMFTVAHAHPYRNFNNQAIYYKVMLTKFNLAANILGVNQNIEDKLRSLTRNSTIDELFGLEQAQDKLAVANKLQHIPLSKDLLRVSYEAEIVRGLIENGEMIIAKSHYDLSSVSFNPDPLDAVVYENMKYWFPVSDNIAYMCWFQINNWTLNDNYHLFNYYDSTNSKGFKVKIYNGEVVVTLNSTNYTLPLTNQLSEGVWYAYIVNVNQRQRKVNQFIYKRNVDNEADADTLNSTKLRLVYSNQIEMTQLHEFLIEDNRAKLLSGDMRITNIRLFTDVLPVDYHNKILNQAIVGENSKYLVFADNANQRIVLPNFPLGQVGPNDV